MACIDAHAHLALRPGAAGQLIASMDRLGIDQTFVVGGGLMSPRELSHRLNDAAPAPHRVAFDNDALFEICQAYEGRLLPFFFADPWDGAAGYFETGARFHGLKLAPGIHGMPLAHPLHDEFFVVAKAHRHPVYLHCLALAGFRVEDLVPVARRHPHVTFILGHAGVGNLDYAAVDLIGDQRNILFETSGGFQAVIVHAVQTLGTERVLFGSEYPLQDPESELTKIGNLPLAAAEIALIRGGNAARLALRGHHAPELL